MCRSHTVWTLHGVRPHLPVLDAKRHLLYVTTELVDAVTVDVDTRTQKIVGKVPTGAEHVAHAGAVA